MNSIHVATTRWPRNKGKTRRQYVQPKLTASNLSTRFSAPRRFYLFGRLTRSSKLFNFQTTKKIILAHGPLSHNKTWKKRTESSKQTWLLSKKEENPTFTVASKTKWESGEWKQLYQRQNKIKKKMKINLCLAGTSYTARVEIKNLKFGQEGKERREWELWTAGVSR